MTRKNRDVGAQRVLGSGLAKHQHTSSVELFPSLAETYLSHLTVRKNPSVAESYSFSLLAILATPTYGGGEHKVCFYFIFLYLKISTFISIMLKIWPFE